MTIRSSSEFVALRSSDNPKLYNRAAREDAPIEVWNDVIDNYPEYRKWVAHNKTVPLGILRILATDDDPEVRSFVVMKRSLPEDILALLAHDYDSGIRLKVAEHKNTSEKILSQLINDTWDRVRQVARSRLR